MELIEVSLAVAMVFVVVDFFPQSPHGWIRALIALVLSFDGWLVITHHGSNLSWIVLVPAAAYLAALFGAVADRLSITAIVRGSGSRFPRQL